MISDGAIKVGELHFAGPVPDEGDYPTELEATCGIYCTWIDPKLLGENRKGAHEETWCVRSLLMRMSGATTVGILSH